ncbi:MAG TPA: S-formylglutathione hydrolase [Polyangia bacterium]
MTTASATSALKARAEHRAFDGRQGFYEHDSAACAGPMRFSIYLPPAALGGARVPALYFLAGLTCNDETFMVKAGAQRVAAALGLALVACDTSPRAARFDGDDEAWDFGVGAGFYVDATEAPWSEAYRMHSYVVDELPALVEREFPVDGAARGIFGHSMGGHGALVAALRRPERYRSVSAFAPISAPSEVPWGQKAFSRYLGADRARWAEWDACALLGRSTFPGTLLVDQGTADKFLVEQLKPERLREACAAAGQPLALRVHDGYDHSYWTIATFVEEHLRHHARALGL